jgi:hypothetical protein
MLCVHVQTIIGNASDKEEHNLGVIMSGSTCIGLRMLPPAPDVRSQPVHTSNSIASGRNNIGDIAT